VTIYTALAAAPRILVSSLLRHYGVIKSGSFAAGPFFTTEEDRSMTDQSSLRQLAIQIASQLPEDREMSLKILKFAIELVDWRAGDAAPPPARLYALHNPPPAA
jgi:hypothetical protein